MQKLDFNDVIRDNIDYIKSIVRKYAKNEAIIEELTQEIFLRAYKSYDQYIEQGKVRHWLAVIAENKLKKDYKSNQKHPDICYDIDSAYFQNTISAPESDNPENIIINNELTEKITSIINKLPNKQRDIIMYRYVYDYSVKEVEQIMGITASNVKVTAHNAINSIREKMGINIYQTKLTKEKGENIMKFDKQTAYSYLYQYAKGHISAENKAAVEEYIKTDEEAANIAEVLRILHPQIVMSKEDELANYTITFQLKSCDRIIYSNFYNDFIQKVVTNVSMGQTLKIFVNEGKEPEVTRKIEENGKVIDTVQMGDEFSWTHFVIYWEKSELFKKSDDAPDLYKISESLNFSNRKEYSKVMIYVALPEEAANIRVKRGNGVIDCGKYKFAYADRYILQDEILALDCTFNLTN